MKLVDFHCHLDLYPDFEELVRESERLRISTLAVTTTPRAWARNNALASGTKYVKAALGLHPQLVAEHWRDFDLWERLLGETRYVGEVGLDAGPRHFNSLPRQEDTFRRILRCCAEAGDKILSIHSVRSASKVLDLIQDEVAPGRANYVFHWFTGSRSEAARAAKLGCYFSVNAQMLLSDRGRALVDTLPSDRLLTETDGPFTGEGDHPARPRDVRRVLELMAAVKNTSSEECAAQVLRNLRSLRGADHS